MYFSLSLFGIWWKMPNFSKVPVDVIELFLVKVSHVLHLFICFVNCLIAPFFSCFLFVWIMAKINACEFFLIRHVYASFRMLNGLFERSYHFIETTSFFYQHFMLEFQCFLSLK